MILLLTAPEGVVAVSADCTADQGPGTENPTCRIHGVADHLGVARLEGVRLGPYQIRIMNMGSPSLADSLTHMPGGTNVAVMLAPGYRGLQECTHVSVAVPSGAGG